MRVFTTAAAIALVSAGAASSATFYSDLATFQGDTTTTVESFEMPYSVSASHVLSDFTIAETGGINAVGVGSPAALGALGLISGTGAAVFDDNGSSILNFSGFSSLFTAFGVWLTSNTNATVTVGGSVSTSFSVLAGVSQFFGVTETLGLSSITFDLSGGPNVGFDDAYTGTAAAVPLPAGLLLLPTGLFALGAIRRRRKAPAAV